MKTSSGGTDAIAISQKAKQQIACEALNSDAKLRGPSFLDGFPDGGSLPQTVSTGVNVATVPWKI
jgi:hypothetical protein